MNELRYLIEPDAKTLNEVLLANNTSYAVVGDVDYSNRLRASLIVLSEVTGGNNLEILNSKNTSVSGLLHEETKLLTTYYDKYIEDIQAFYSILDLLRDSDDLESFFKYANDLDDKILVMFTMIQHEPPIRARETIGLLNFAIACIKHKQTQIIIKYAQETQGDDEQYDKIDVPTEGYIEQAKYIKDRAEYVEQKKNMAKQYD